MDADKKVKPEPENFSICISCGQCMMVCPTKAAQVEGLDYEKDFFNYVSAPSDFDSFSNTMVRRRSVRSFKDRPIPPELLERITSFLRHAPFGVSHDNAEVTVINDRQLIERSLPLMQKLYRMMGKLFGNAVGRIFFRMMTNASDYNTVVEHLLPLLKREEFFVEGGKDWITRGAPALMLFHGKKSAQEYISDSWIMINYAMMSAQYLGLGSTIIGLIPPAINQSKDLRKMLSIPNDHKVICALILGYPKHRYLRAYLAKERIINII
jgi:nitroreductase